MAKLLFVYLRGCFQCKLLECLLERSDIRHSSIDIFEFISTHLSLQEREKYKTKAIQTPMLLWIEKDNQSVKQINLHLFFSQFADSKKT